MSTKINPTLFKAMLSAWRRYHPNATALQLANVKRRIAKLLEAKS